MVDREPNLTMEKSMNNCEFFFFLNIFNSIRNDPSHQRCRLKYTVYSWRKQYYYQCHKKLIENLQKYKHIHALMRRHPIYQFDIHFSFSNYAHISKYLCVIWYKNLQCMFIQDWYINGLVIFQFSLYAILWYKIMWSRKFTTCSWNQVFFSF